MDSSEGGTVVDGEVHAHLDVRGLVCPEPVLRARKILETLKPGQRLEVLADDPVALLDFSVFSHRTGHPLRESRAESGYFRLVLEHR